MNPFRTLALVVALSFGLQALPVLADDGSSGDPTYKIQNPPAYAMIGDLLVARPLLVGATLIGTAVFVVSLPFTVFGGIDGVGKAGKALVVAPGKAAFARCLGCTAEGFDGDH
ncbi:multidrug transporter [Pseudomonas batumici]|uniref:multidrug transporter n=1 Tax=Pseudomonas batumici TaxID=226910 RepID=UPI0030CEBC95